MTRAARARALIRSETATETERLSRRPLRQLWQSPGVIVATARQAAEQLEPLFACAEGEMLAVMLLDEERRIIAILQFPGGEPDTMLLPIRKIFTAALGLGGTGLVIAHNHPSGDPQPGPTDIEATGRLAETAATLGIRLHDHLIFGGGAWRSFRELGLL